MTLSLIEFGGQKLMACFIDVRFCKWFLVFYDMLVWTVQLFVMSVNRNEI